MPRLKSSAKHSAQRLLPRRFYAGAKEVLYSFRLSEVERRLAESDAKIARLRYGASSIGVKDREWSLREEELSVYSQNGEDGILLFMLSGLKELSHHIIEVGSADGRECNSANLVLNWGWSAQLMDGDDDQISSARRYYDEHSNEVGARVETVAAFVTTDNINDLIPRAGKGPDILSIDIDGNDYWIWEAVDIRPSIVVVEYNASFGPDASVVVPYDPGFERFAAHESGLYHGASLTAMTRLALRLGYVLVGCDSRGVNAFFVRRDRAGDIPTLNPQDAWRPHSTRLRTYPHEHQESIALAAGPLVEVLDQSG